MSAARRRRHDDPSASSTTGATSSAAERCLNMELNFERHRAGPPLLLIHGLGGSVRSWDSILPMLASEREVILVDLPGHGGSPALPGRQTIAAYADALEHFIEVKQE